MKTRVKNNDVRFIAKTTGAGQLAGLAGKLTINIAADGKHSYDFEYTLPERK